MNVVIQGHGVIGQATHALLDALGHEVTVHDPPAGVTGHPSEVCVVATPCADGFLDDPEWACRSERVVVRSTVRPEAFDAVSGACHWPEFLTEVSALDDVFHPDKLVWGGDPELMVRLLGEHHRKMEGRTVVTTPQAAAVAKLAVNTLYTAKVLLFNAFYDADPDGYGDVCASLALDQRITLSHHDPFHGGYRGAGGKCLPKDTANLAAFLKGSWAGDLIGCLVEHNTTLRGR